MNAREARREGDDRVMELLRRSLAEADAVPAEVVSAARETWTWRTIDAELAELARDSFQDDVVGAGVRGTTTVRALSFAAGSLFIEVEVTEDRDRRSLVGQIMPPAELASDASVLAETPDGRPTIVVPVDDLGRFQVDGMAAGLVRLRVQGARSLVTEWVAI